MRRLKIVKLSGPHTDVGDGNQSTTPTACDARRFRGRDRFVSAKPAPAQDRVLLEHQGLCTLATFFQHFNNNFTTFFQHALCTL